MAEPFLKISFFLIGLDSFPSYRILVPWRFGEFSKEMHCKNQSQKLLFIALLMEREIRASSKHKIHQNIMLRIHATRRPTPHTEIHRAMASLIITSMITSPNPNTNPKPPKKRVTNLISVEVLDEVHTLYCPTFLELPLA